MIEIKIQKRKVSEIIFKEDLYARITHDNSLIKYYSENIKSIDIAKSFIHISKDNILIDGFHRLKAYEMAYGKEHEISCYVHNTDNTDYIELKSYSSNTKHGQKNSKEDNKRNIRRLYAKSHSLETIRTELSLSKSFVYDATIKQREDEKIEREKAILEMYLHGNETQQSVADRFKLPRKTVDDILGGFSKHGIFAKTPILYNIWNEQKGNDTDHFGSFPIIFMENLLNYHTEPMDIVFDPFAGDGTTVDACKKMMRRYYCSDLEVKPGREKDIYLHDITTGLPEDLKKPDLVFLDPPYWKQANGKYIEHENQLGNIESLEDFNDIIQSILDSIRKWKVNKIAIVIQPTQYINDFEFTDHIFDFHTMLSKWYKIEGRYILPYSTQQYNAQMVEKAKEENKCLVLNRDLIVWKMK